LNESNVEESVRVIAGILLLITGITFPLAMLFWLNGRLHRPPPLQPRQVGLLLAFNGVSPLGLIVLGLGLLSPKFGGTLTFWAVMLSTGLVAVALLIGLWWTVMVARRGDDGGK
jgi:hypothetical protein